MIKLVSNLRIASRVSTLSGRRLMMAMSARGYATRRYTPEHEWISVSDGVGTMGISQYAQSALGDVVYVEVPSVGTKLNKKDTLGAVESVKAASDIYAPVSGEIVSANEELVKEPTLINVAPHTDGWVCKIKLSNPKELDGLMDEAAYVKHCEK